MKTADFWCIPKQGGQGQTFAMAPGWQLLQRRPTKLVRHISTKVAIERTPPIIAQLDVKMYDLGKVSLEMQEVYGLEAH